jgi:hypothetical protein
LSKNLIQDQGTTDLARALPYSRLLHLYLNSCQINNVGAAYLFAAIGGVENVDHLIHTAYPSYSTSKPSTSTSSSTSSSSSFSPPSDWKTPYPKLSLLTLSLNKNAISVGTFPYVPLPSASSSSSSSSTSSSSSSSSLVKTLSLLCYALAHSSLTTLNLESMKYNQTSLEALSVALPTSSLSRLNLGYCELTDAGLSELNKALSNTPSLRDLVIGLHSGVKSESVKALAATLSGDKSRIRRLRVTKRDSPSLSLKPLRDLPNVVVQYATTEDDDDEGEDHLFL